MFKTVKELLEEAEAFERARSAAVKDGDWHHADELKRRAESVRRQAREQEAGVRSSMLP